MCMCTCLRVCVRTCTHPVPDRFLCTSAHVNIFCTLTPLCVSQGDQWILGSPCRQSGSWALTSPCLAFAWATSASARRLVVSRAPVLVPAAAGEAVIVVVEAVIVLSAGDSSKFRGVCVCVHSTCAWPLPPPVCPVICRAVCCAGDVVRAPCGVMHGKTSLVHHTNTGVLEGLEK